MEITDVIVHTVSVGAVEGEKADGSQDAAIIELETDAGITGIGEADSSPAVVKAIVDAPVSHDKAAGLREVVRGWDPFDVKALWNEMYDRTYFYGRKGAALTAISAVDMACWDIMGKATDRPVHQLLGGRHRESVRAYASTLFPDDPTETEHMRREAETALGDGFTAIKFGWGGFGEDPDRDLALVGAARDVLGPEVDIMVDAGFAYNGDVKGAIRRINAIDEAHDIYWLEEPVYADDLTAYRRIAEGCGTRVVGGENEYTASGFRDFVAAGVDGVQPDVARSGGITHMVKIADIAANAGIPFLPHGYSTDIIVAANLQLIAATPNAPLLEYCVEDSPIRWDMVEEDFPVRDGRVRIPDRPGLGVTLNREAIDKYRSAV